MITKFQPSDSMASLIGENYHLLQVMSRFDIPFGLTDRSIATLCYNNGVDTETFLAVANLIAHSDLCWHGELVIEDLSLSDLMKYIRNSHSYYLNFKLPKIRKDMMEALAHSEMKPLLIKYFDDYVSHFKKHLRYEEVTLFPYINAIISGENIKNYSIARYRDKHDKVHKPLAEFKNVIIKYYSGEPTYELMSVINDLLNCTADISMHNAVEDRLLIPIVLKIEEGERCKTRE